MNMYLAPTIYHFLDEHRICLNIGSLSSHSTAIASAHIVKGRLPPSQSDQHCLPIAAMTTDTRTETTATTTPSSEDNVVAKIPTHASNVVTKIPTNASNVQQMTSNIAELERKLTGVASEDFKPSKRLYVAFLTLAVITLMVALDGTSLSVALPVC